MATPQEPQQKGLNLEHKCYAIHKINQCHDFTQLRNELSAFFDLDLDLSKLINFLRKANRNNGALFNRLEEMAESESGFSKSVWFIERPVTQMRPTFVLGSADTRVEVRAFLVVNAPQSANGSVQQLTAHYNQTFPGEPYTSAQISIRLSKALSEGNVATQLKQFAARYSWYPVGLQAGSVPRPRTNVEVKEEAKVRRKKSRATFEAMKDSEAALVWQQKLMGESSRANNTSASSTPAPNAANVSATIPSTDNEVKASSLTLASVHAHSVPNLGRSLPQDGPAKREKAPTKHRVDRSAGGRSRSASPAKETGATVGKKMRQRD